MKSPGSWSRLERQLWHKEPAHEFSRLAMLFAFIMREWRDAVRSPGTEQCGKLAHEFKVTALRIVVWIDHDLLDQTANRRDHFELPLGLSASAARRSRTIVR